MIKYWAAIGVAIACNVIANLSLKSLPKILEQRSLTALLTVPAFWILVVTGAGLLASYAYAVSGMRLHVAYTFVTSGALVIIAFVSTILFQQIMTPLNWLGILLIVAGIWLVAR